MFGSRKIALALAAILAFTPAASAQDFSNIVSFGDSLSDSGVAPQTNGLFSNGPVWVDQLANDPSIVDPAGTNFNSALSGAEAQEVPAQIATVPGTAYGPSSLVTVWTGANDIQRGLAAAAPGGANAVLQLGGVTAGEQLTNVGILAGTLAAGGGGTILVPNLPNLGGTPGAAAAEMFFPGTIAGLNAATFGYNSTLASNLPTISAPGVNIILMDVNSAFSAVLANPTAFGFSNATGTCTGVINGTPGDPCAPGTENFLFWDGIHPTTAGHALLAQLATALLTFDDAAQNTAAHSEVGLNLRRQGIDDIFDRTDSWITGTYARQNGLWAEIKGYQGDEDSGANRIGYDYSAYGVRAGVDLELTDTLVGASFGVLRGNFDTGALDSDFTSVQFDLYGSRWFGPFFATAQAGMAGTLDSESERATGIGPIKAEGNADSYQFDVAGEVGALFNLGNFSVIPAARLTYILSHTGSYTEDAPVAALEYGSHEVDALFGTVRLRGVAKLGAMSGFLEVGYEDALNYSSDAFTAAIFNNTGAPATIALGDQSTTGLYFKGGLDGKINDNIALNFQYGFETRNGDGEAHTGKLRLKYTR